MAHFKVFAGMAAAAMLVLGMPAQASVSYGTNFIGANTNTNIATATFDIVGDILTIRLSNISPDPTGVNPIAPGNVLTGISFSFAQPGALTKSGGSVVADTYSTDSGSRAIIGSLYCNSADVATCSAQNSSVNVGGEFGFSTASAWPGAGNYGVASAGYVGGPKTRFIIGGPPGATNELDNLEGQEAPNGVNFGIVSSAWLSGSGMDQGKVNGGLMSVPLIYQAVLISLAGVESETSTDAISNVSFWFGTMASENPGGGNPGCPGGEVAGCGGIDVPEPSSMWLMLIGLLGLGAFASTRKLGV